MFTFIRFYVIILKCIKIQLQKAKCLKMIEKKDIIKAYLFLTDKSEDDMAAVADFMKTASIEKLNSIDERNEETEVTKRKETTEKPETQESFEGLFKK